jgi:type IV pilus assembly protein PilB
MVALGDAADEMGRFALDRGLIDPINFKLAENRSRETGINLYDSLVSENFINDSVIKESLSAYLDLPLAPQEFIQDPFQFFADVIPRNYVIENRIIPFNDRGEGLKVAVAEPSALRGIGSIKLITGKKVSASIVSPHEMQKLLELIQSNISSDTSYPDKNVQLTLPVTSETLAISTPDATESKVRKKRDKPHDEKSSKATKNDASAQLASVVANDDQQGNQIIQFVNALIFDAVSKGASDIHIEAYKDAATARYRIDGVLEEVKDLKDFIFGHYSAVTTRIKIMAQLDISERRLPQDGSVVAMLPNNREIDLRVSVLPTIFGERVVMRILDREGTSFDLEKLGFPEKEFKDLIYAVDASQGMVLVTGPTGSGKSTTLYGVLRRLNLPDVNILTAEDPVEFTMEGIGQVQIREDIGLSFAQALRSFLRQDPEVILVGEIRDKDTADISIKASLTGHLVLSTLHANDAISTIVRLLNMGIPGYLIGAALTLVVAQRLGRKICPHCKQEHVGNHEALLLDLGFNEDEARNARPFFGVGCNECNGTGYKGRQGIYEVLKIDDQLRAAIIANESATTLREIALRSGFRTIQEIGRQMVLDGRLTIDEYQRNLIFH